MITTTPPMFRPILLLPVLALALGAAAPNFVHEESDLPADPAVTWGKMENGMRFALMPNAEPPGRVSLRLHIDSGSLHETEDQRGLAHFLEHMAFNGTRNFKPDELVTFLQGAGIGFGAHLNAYTSFDETVYMLDLPKNDAELVDKCLLVLRDWADGMTLGAEEIEKERGVILSEKRDRDSVEMRLMEKQLQDILPEARVTHRFPIGTEEVITGAPREEFVAYYEGNYASDRMTLVAVGDFDPAEMEKRIRDQFGDMPAAKEKVSPVDMGQVGKLGHHFRNDHDPEVKAVEVDITHIRPAEPRSDTRADRLRRMPLAAAHAMLTRRLEILAKEEGSPIVDGGASHSEFLDFVAFTGINATAEGGRWEDALALVTREWQRALQHGFTASEFEEIKAKRMQAAEDAVKAKATRRSANIAMGIIGALGADMVYTSPETNLELLRAGYGGLTPDICHQAFKEAWKGDDLVVSVTSRKPVEGGVEAIEKVWSKARQAKVDPPVDEGAAEFAYATVGRPGTVAARTTHDDLEVTQLVLSNGVRINLKQTDFRRNTINILARFGGGKLEMPADKPGFDIFAGAVFNAGGLEAHSADEIERLFAGRKVSTGFAVADDAFTLAGTTTPEDLSDQLHLLCAYLQHPGFRPEAERQFKKAVPIVAMQMTSTAEGVLGSRGQRLMAGGDKRFGLEDPMQLAAYTTAEVRDWLASPLRDSYLEVSVVGDFDPEVTEALLLGTFGALPDRAEEKPAFTRARERPPIPAGDHVITFSSKIGKAFNLALWPTTDQSDIGKARRLNVLGAVLGDRLRVKVREELGDAYSPGAASRTSDTWKDRGEIIAYSPGDPAESDKVLRVIRGLATDLAANGADPDELKRAIKPILASIDEQLRENSYWLQTVLAASQEQPQRLDWARSMKEDYASVTLHDINRLAAEYLAPDRARTLVITTGVVEGEEKAEREDEEAEAAEAA